MNARLLPLAARIIQKTDRSHPADEVLRTELKNARGISRTDSGVISAAVFAYHRWLRWLDSASPLKDQIKAAGELDEAFQKNPKTIPDPELTRAIPDWANQEIKLSPEWLRTLQMVPPLWLRARPGQGASLGERLGECETAGEGMLGDALLYHGSEDLFRIPEFHAGEFELQDISSQAVGWLCHPQPGETWWDACAGEGGKTLHLSDLMQNRGMLWASDRAEWRLQKLKRRAARAKSFNYRTALWDGGAKLPTKTRFDGILVDAPCTGVGTWQRNPQMRWTLTPEDVTGLAAIQKQILANVVPALKPGGRLIYSVCTLTTAETTEVFQAISEQFSDLVPLPVGNPFRPTEPAAGSLWLWPQETHGNGMFVCAWQKAGLAKP